MNDCIEISITVAAMVKFAISIKGKCLDACYSTVNMKVMKVRANWHEIL